MNLCVRDVFGKAIYGAVCSPAVENVELCSSHSASRVEDEDLTGPVAPRAGMTE